MPPSGVQRDHPEISNITGRGTLRYTGNTGRLRCSVASCCFKGVPLSRVLAETEPNNGLVLKLGSSIYGRGAQRPHLLLKQEHIVTYVSKIRQLAFTRQRPITPCLKTINSCRLAHEAADLPSAGSSRVNNQGQLLHNAGTKPATSDMASLASAVQMFLQRKRQHERDSIHPSQPRR